MCIKRIVGTAYIFIFDFTLFFVLLPTIFIITLVLSFHPLYVFIMFSFRCFVPQSEPFSL